MIENSMLASDVSDDELAFTLRQMFVEVLELDMLPEQINDETNLFDLGIDSLSVLRLLMSIQERFGIEIPEAALTASMFERFGNLVATVSACR